MGSRGNYVDGQGFSEYRYSTVYREGELRFVKLNDERMAVKTPEMSNSPGAVYATLSRRGDLQAISFYDSERRKYKEIDFLHYHDGLKPHVHDIDVDSISLRPAGGRALNDEEKAYVAHVYELYLKNVKKKGDE